MIGLIHQRKSKMTTQLTNEEVLALRVKELRTQFRGNAKYVVLEIMEEIKKFEYGHPILVSDRLEFWSGVKQGLEK